MAMNELLDRFPVFVWNGIFNFATALTTALLMALLTTFYLKRRDERTRVSGVILEKRVNAEQKILDFLEGLSFHREMSRRDSECYYTLLKEWDFHLPHGRNLQYSDVFSDTNSFREFFKGFEQIIATHKLWLGQKTLFHLTLMQAYFSWVNALLIMLQRVHLPDEQKLTEGELNELADKLILLIGVTLDDEIGGLLAHLEVLMVDSIYRLDMKRPKTSLMRDGLLNRDTLKIIKVLSTQTALGVERENYFSLVVLLVFIKKNIPLDKDAVMHAALNLGEQQT